MKKHILKKKLPAFTLQELLIVLVIVGILVLLALPNLMPKISEAKAQEAKLQLKHLHTLQKSYFFMYSKYSSSFEDIGFEHSKLTTDNGTANYQIEIVEASNTGFKAKATAITDFDADGQFNTWEVDQDMNLKETQKD
ncbi:MAG: general secretion pathway protein GspG [Flavobacteriales bacterium]|nr:MAG: general secretion pathway protein GspG [Flavobacteriales bacterium]